MNLHEIEELRSEVISELESLGGNAFEVACTLEAIGVVGMANNGLCCPLAHHLNLVYRNRGIDFRVQRSVARMYLMHPGCHGPQWESLGEAKLPSPCVEFVLRIDNREYPWLVREMPHHTVYCTHT
jgi:hypothetical protein